MSQIQFNTQLTDQIKVSDEAVKQLLALTENEDGVNGVRIFVSGGGCGGMTYGMTFTGDRLDNDKILETSGFKVYIDSNAYDYLKGVEIDYVENGMNGASFVFNNVFQSTGGSGACGACGSAGGGCA